MHGKDKKEPSEDEIKAQKKEKARKDKVFKEFSDICGAEESKALEREAKILNASKYIGFGEIRNNDDTTGLHRAAKEGDIKELKNMIQKGFDVNVTDKDGNTPLMYACDKDQFEAVVLLIENKADVNKKSTRGGFTPLMFAAWHGHNDIVTLLCKHEAKMNIQNAHGDTALHFAAARGHAMTCLMLRREGADEMIKNAEKKTPIDNEARFEDEMEVSMKRKIPSTEVEFEKSKSKFGISQVASEFTKYMESNGNKQ